MSVPVPRMVAAVATTATASLFSTIFAIAAMGASSLHWDGSFCTTKTCARTAVAIAPARSATPFGAIVR